MTPGFRNTLVASFALAGLLNFIQISADYNSHAKDAFSADATIAESQVPTIKTTSAAITPISSPGQSAASPSPRPDPLAAAQSRLTAARLKPDYAAVYLAAQARTGTPWQLLAAVHHVETGQSGDTARTSYAGAVGPMQFMPATFSRYALDGDGDGTKQITNLNDAVFSAANYLRAGGADKGRYASALYNYNHSNTYVNNVLTIARRLGL